MRMPTAAGVFALTAAVALRRVCARRTPLAAAPEPPDGAFVPEGCPPAATDRYFTVGLE